MDSLRKPCTSVGLGAFRLEENEEKMQVAENTQSILLDCKTPIVYCSGVSNPITEAARLLGSIKTKKKARSSRENGKKGAPYGKLGGRPKGKKKKVKRAA